MVFKGDKAIEYLSGSVQKQDKAESSHWKHYNSGFKYTGNGFQGLSGFGGNDTYSATRQWMHNFFQRNMLQKIAVAPQFSGIDKLARSIARKQNRIYDLDFLRQSLSLSFIKSHTAKTQSVFGYTWVIGDGFGSMTSILLESNTTQCVVLVNLSKVLMVDLFYLKLWMGDAKFSESVALLTDSNDCEAILENKSGAGIRVIAIEAENHELLTKLPSDLVINIVSMGEMNPQHIEGYFNDIRTSVNQHGKCFFYCCNREEKKLPDGTITRISEYPWIQSDQILIDELCPWHQKYYSFRPPFYRQYDGPIRHQLRIMQ